MEKKEELSSKLETIETNLNTKHLQSIEDVKQKHKLRFEEFKLKIVAKLQKLKSKNSINQKTIKHDKSILLKDLKYLRDSCNKRIIAVEKDSIEIYQELLAKKNKDDKNSKAKVDNVKVPRSPSSEAKDIKFEKEIESLKREVKNLKGENQTLKESLFEEKELRREIESQKYNTGDMSVDSEMANRENPSTIKDEINLLRRQKDKLKHQILEVDYDLKTSKEEKKKESKTLEKLKDQFIELSGKHFRIFLFILRMFHILFF